MGVSINSQNHSIDMGYGGFNRLRNKVAELTNKEIYEHYLNLNDGMYLTGEENEKFYEEYDKKIEELDIKYDRKYNSVLYFLYESDCDGSMPPKVCKSIWEVIKDYDDNICYGYCGRPDCAMFKDFKKIVKDCIDNNCCMTWY